YGSADAAPDEVALTYDLLRLGLRGQALRALGKLGEARQALGARHALLLEREKRRGLDDDLLALALAESQLAEVAARGHAHDEAARFASQALGHADALAKRAGTPLHDAQIATLSHAAELHLTGHVPANAFGFDLAARLRSA